MPWQSATGNGRNGGNCCKVRKRGGSSSSSSTVRSYRLKRAVLVGKRGGGSMMSSSTTTSAIQKNDAKSYNYSEKEKELLVSARKLAANLWQINGGLKGENNVEERGEVKLGRKERVLKANSKAWQSDDHSQGIDKILQTDYPFESDCFMKARNRLKDVRHGLSTSKQLLEVVSHVWSVEEQQSTCLTLFSALKSELNRACIHVSKLIKEQKHSHGAIDFLVEQFEKEKSAWKMREEYRIQSAITAISGDLETEKKRRRQTERLNKKLGSELADTKASLLKATKELESEKKRANEILEQVCDDSEGSKKSYAEWSSGLYYEGDSKAWKRDCKDESERYNRIRNLKEQIVSASRTSSQDFTFI